MIRRVIQIDEEACNGCGLCAAACHEGAIGIVDGKARLLRDDYCDGFGDCLPECPTGAISFVEREAAAYDAAAVEKNKAAKAAAATVKQVASQVTSAFASWSPAIMGDGDAEAGAHTPSSLDNWPVQIKLAPVNAACFDGAHLLVAADCCAFAYADFHRDFIAGHTTLVGCPKLDAVDYSEKLAQIISGNDVVDVTIARMTVPCCGGLERAVERAIALSGKDIPCVTRVITLDGNIQQ